MALSPEYIISSLTNLYGSEVVAADVRAWCAMNGTTYQTVTKKLDSYKKGIHCKNCINKRSLKQINSSTTRQQQINRAELNNMSHPFKKIYN